MGDILALDLGTKTGWAFYPGKEETYKKIYGEVSIDVVKPSFGMQDFSTTRFEGGGMRYLRFQRWLETFQPDEVYFEEVRSHMGTDAAHAYGGFLGILTSWCENKSIPYKGVPVKTIKKHITGTGNANKQAVINAVREKGYRVDDENEADAVALLLYIKEREYE